ncbi:hypothetical protein L596_026288 [Steinernema carpocapsae]|uniref:Uncharacterized protein n=1 Tax=Steinernema carpocapsae TaxID=34508 RepID=A0A4U5M0W7_STECR|nr:hypothetical protein L596_026288 [Steinernema carpocapsae]
MTSKTNCRKFVRRRSYRRHPATHRFSKYFENVYLYGKDDACSNAAYDAPFVATPTQNARRNPRRAFCATADAASQRSIRGHPRRTTQGDALFSNFDAAARRIIRGMPTLPHDATTHHSWHANAAARRTTHHSWPAL